jgi:hypothetical protein
MVKHFNFSNKIHTHTLHLQYITVLLHLFIKPFQNLTTQKATNCEEKTSTSKHETNKAWKDQLIKKIN